MDTPSISLKRCVKCMKEFPATVEFFYWRKDIGKFRAECKVCKRKYQRQYGTENVDKIREYRIENADKRREACRQWRAKNVDKVSEYNRQWRVDNVDKERERQHQYHAENADKIRKRMRQYHIENADKVREYGRQYRAENLDKRRANEQRRRARKLGNGGSFTAEDIQLQIQSQTNKKGAVMCWWCSKPIKDGYHVDHRIPLVKGGSNAPDNLVIAHRDCNLSKGGKLPHEWNGRLL